MIRVISGKYKGKRLKRVPGTVVRTIPHKLKESLFNIIQDEVKKSIFLDGFAGTGSVGIEALSRGCKMVVFVDEYYPATNDFDAAALSDTDGDGFAAWEEYVAATDPTNAASLFELVYLSADGDVIEWRSAKGKLYIVEYTTNLAGSPFQVLGSASNVFGSSGFTTFTNRLLTNRPCFYYRVKVRR